MARTAHEREAPARNTGYVLILSRLLKTENWDDMTAAANASPDHTGNLDRWRRQIRAHNPGLSDERVDRLAAKLQTLYFQELGRRSGEARRAAREAAAEGMA